MILEDLKAMAKSDRRLCFFGSNTMGYGTVSSALLLQRWLDVENVLDNVRYWIYRGIWRS